MRITIFGSGYVGLVAGTCFAEMGNDVTLVDVDADKVAALQRGEIPIYEPGLTELLEDNVHTRRLSFSTDAKSALVGAEACFICVGTPMGPDGHADLRYVESVARTIGHHIDDFTVVVTKSTVPVGTAEKVRAWVRASLDARGADGDFAVASNPEFLKEGAAIDDFMKPDRVVIGVDDPRAEAILRDIYGVFMRNGLRLFVMDVPSAEMTKYAANCMLATKISFINEIANICEAVGADVELVRQGVGADKRIGTQFLFPGLGYGGSCFPKDVRELMRTAEDFGYAPRIIQAVDAVNDDQKRSVERKLSAWCELNGRSVNSLTVAVWGLAFKPNTDDVRESPALELIRFLSGAGAQVQAHDPHALETAQAALGDLPGVSYTDDPYQATEGADLMCLLTEWRPFRRPDFRRLAGQLTAKTIFDGRNQYDGKRLAEYGLQVYGVGTGARLGAPC
ncbi:MAG: UDP-glucose/GDP-mannose dehydrogenase family protein [Planctomycetota bacterium]|jgi:UDPglucose 6-dehydrogenase|nr:UDP-glucose/GDP-mannose dehydrogenase family protein [Planctomycetota bacterium]